MFWQLFFVFAVFFFKRAKIGKERATGRRSRGGPASCSAWSQEGGFVKQIGKNLTFRKCSKKRGRRLFLMSSHGFGSPVSGWWRAVRAPLVSNGMLVVLQRRARRDATSAPLQPRKGLTAGQKNRRKITNIHILLNNSGLRKAPKICDFRTKTGYFPKNGVNPEPHVRYFLELLTNR